MNQKSTLFNKHEVSISEMLPDARKSRYLYPGYEKLLVVVILALRQAGVDTVKNITKQTKKKRKVQKSYKKIKKMKLHNQVKQ